MDVIKFLDLQKINAQYGEELKAAATRVIDSGWYLLGRELEGFERNYASFCGTNRALGVANGLDALRLIFKAYIELGVLPSVTVYGDGRNEDGVWKMVMYNTVISEGQVRIDPNEYPSYYYRVVVVK